MSDIKNLAHAQSEVPEELENLKTWWNANGNYVTIALLALLVAVVGIRFFRSWSEKRTAAVMTEFSSASGAEQLEKIIADAKVASVVPLARLRLAGFRYSKGEYDQAKAAYAEFLDASPEHPLAGIARIGLAFCDEALGDVAAAANGFKNFLDSTPDSFLAPHARLGHARCLFLTKNEEDRRTGKAELDLYLTEAAGGQWAAQIDELIHAAARISVPEKKNAADDISAFMEEPAAPAAEEPDAPAAEEPAAPAAEEPDAPAAEEPDAPAAGEPAAAN